MICRGPGTAGRHAAALRRESVSVDQDAMGGYSVDMAKYGWFPEELPSETALIEAQGPDEEQ